VRLTTAVCLEQAGALGLPQELAAADYLKQHRVTLSAAANPEVWSMVVLRYGFDDLLQVDTLRDSKPISSSYLMPQIHLRTLVSIRGVTLQEVVTSRVKRLIRLSYFKPDGYCVTFAFAYHFSDVGFDRQFMSAVTQGHERTLKGVSVNCSPDLHKSLGLKDSRRIVQYYIRPSAFGRRPLQLGGKLLVHYSSIWPGRAATPVFWEFT
jgi:hypothetical protein